MTLHLIKLCVGIDSYDHLVDWQKRKGVVGADGIKRSFHVTRNRPKRADELLDGGSLYWVIRGSILARNPIIGLENVEAENGKTKCRIVLASGPIRTLPKKHRIFQGWRYFDGERAPVDMSSVKGDLGKLPDQMADELANLGLI